MTCSVTIASTGKCNRDSVTWLQGDFTIDIDKSASASQGACSYCSLGQDLGCPVHPCMWFCREKACCRNGLLHRKVVTAFQDSGVRGRLLLTWRPDSRAAIACNCSQSLAHHPSGHSTGHHALRRLLQVAMASESEIKGHIITNVTGAKVLLAMNEIMAHVLIAAPERLCLSAPALAEVQTFE